MKSNDYIDKLFKQKMLKVISNEVLYNIITFKYHNMQYSLKNDEKLNIITPDIIEKSFKAWMDVKIELPVHETKLYD